MRLQFLWKCCKNAPSHRDITGHYVNSSKCTKLKTINPRLNSARFARSCEECIVFAYLRKNREQAESCQCWRFVTEDKYKKHYGYLFIVKKRHNHKKTKHSRFSVDELSLRPWKWLVRMIRRRRLRKGHITK